MALDVDAVICLGCVIRGETAHFEHVAGQAAAGIMRVGLDTGKPVMFGVLTTEDLEQALARSMPEPGAHNVGYECAEGAVEMVRVLAQRAPVPTALSVSCRVAPHEHSDDVTSYGVAMQVTVLGAGSWGTTVAALIAPRHPTVLWARNTGRGGGDRPRPHEHRRTCPGSRCPSG